VLELLGIDRFQGTIWNWIYKLSEGQSDEKQIEVDSEKDWLYAAIDPESKLLLEIGVFSSPRTREWSA